MDITYHFNAAPYMARLTLVNENIASLQIMRNRGGNNSLRLSLDERDVKIPLYEDVHDAGHADAILCFAITRYEQEAQSLVAIIESIGPKPSSETHHAR